MTDDILKAMPPKSNKEGIRIGTLVRGNESTSRYISDIVQHGFESFQIIFWQTTNEVELSKLAMQVGQALEGTDAVVSSLGIFGNPLDPQAEKHEETLQSWKRCIDHANDFGCNLVCGFAGRLIDKPIDHSIGRFKEVFEPLARYAEDRGVKLAFENCDMRGNWERGDWNIAQNPAAWELMFNEVPAENVGLCWEPCHQMVSLIDPLPQLRQWVSKVFHVHGKDATIDWNSVRTHGIHGPKPFAWHRTPGFGDTNWADVISILRLAGYSGSIDIEGWHDPVYRDELEMTGQVSALKYLKHCRGGTYVPNP